MAVAVGTHLEQAPARTQEIGELAAENNAALGFAAFGKFEVMLNVVLEKFADVARIVQIACAEFLGFLSAEILAQQASALGQPIGFVGFDEGNVALPAFAVLDAAQVFVGSAVALVPVFAGQYQNLVVFRVRQGCREGVSRDSDGRRKH